MSHRNVKAATASNVSAEPEDQALYELIQHISTGKSCVWKSLDIKDLYASYGGTMLSRHMLVDILVNHFGNDLILSGHGVASILVLLIKVPLLLKLVDDKHDIDINSIAKKVKKECSEIPTNRDRYKIQLSVETTNSCSDILLNFLAQVSPKVHHTSPALLIGNIAC